MQKYFKYLILPIPFLFVLATASIAEVDQRAIEIINKALAASGGQDELTSLPLIIAKAEGVEHRSAEDQGFAPDEETTAPHNSVLILYPGKDKLVFEHKTGRPDGTTRWRRRIFDGNSITTADLGVEFISTRQSQTASADRKRLERTFPQMILLEASQHPERLRSAGDQQFSNKPHQVVEFQIPDDNTTFRLFLDEQSGVLSKYEYPITYSWLGTVPIAHIFSGYQKHPVLGNTPTQHTITIQGKTFRTENYTNITTRTEDAALYFTFPERLQTQLVAPGSVRRVGDGVYIIHQLNGFTPMFVEFKDFIVAIEAPSNFPVLEYSPALTAPSPANISAEMIKIIRTAVPNKPIKYVVPTHFHSDHSGGINAFLSEGATVVTTPGNRKYVQRLASIGQTSPSKLKIEIFEKSHQITDGEKTLKLFNTGPNPHTTEMTVVFLPQENILFQGDLFYFEIGQIAPPDRVKQLDFFYKWLEKERLKPSKIYGFHSMTYATFEDVEKQWIEARPSLPVSAGPAL